MSKLTDAERSALLRAARYRSKQMLAEIEYLDQHVKRGAKGARAARDIVESEMQLLDGAIKKLWRGAS